MPRRQKLEGHLRRHRGARTGRDVRREVQRLVRLGREAEATAQAIDLYREQVNYVYWKQRCEIEQTDTAIRARKLVYEADQAYRKADLEGMREKYEQAWEEWAKYLRPVPGHAGRRHRRGFGR